MQISWDINYGIGFLNILPRAYDEDYFKKYVGYENTATGRKITERRIAFVDKWHGGKMLDVGVGSGHFCRSRKDTFGYDINPVAIEILKSHGIYADIKDNVFQAYSFFDSFEHIKNHDEMLLSMEKDTFVFMSIPIFTDMTHVLKSKHFRIDEHYWYFTSTGLLKYMTMRGFCCVDIDNFEIKCGREDILSFAFRKISHG